MEIASKGSCALKIRLGKRIRDAGSCEWCSSSLREIIPDFQLLRFIHAPHSRDKLWTSRQMLMLTLTYHQVMPAFLDFLFSFGKQEHAQDFYSSGFQQEDWLVDIDKGLHIPELGRSGREIRLCYSLRAVEPSKSHLDWPWSVRQTALYHSFDFESGQTTWIILKGDQLMKKRIQSATTSKCTRDFQTNDQSFAATFAIHLLLCSWSGEHWRWYINFLEEALQAMTRHTLLVTVDRAPKSQLGNPSFLIAERAF